MARTISRTSTCLPSARLSAYPPNISEAPPAERVASGSPLEWGHQIAPVLRTANYFLPLDGGG